MLVLGKSPALATCAKMATCPDLEPYQLLHPLRSTAWELELTQPLSLRMGSTIVHKCPIIL